MRDQQGVQPNDGRQSLPQKRRRSPNASSFKKGQSGNKKGRPLGSGKQVADPYQGLLSKIVTTTIRGNVREMSIEEAIQRRTFNDALAGKPKAIRQVLEWIKERESWIKQYELKRRVHWETIRHYSPDPDNANQALTVLGIARADRYRATWEHARTYLIIEPWAVERALRKKRNGAQFSQHDWEEIEHCTKDWEVSMSESSRPPTDAEGTDEQP